MTFADEFDPAIRRNYFNHAAISPWPQRTTEAVRAFASENHREGPARYREWIRRERLLRSQLATILGCSSSDIALLKNTTEGICTVAEGINWQPGDNVVLPADEFPSNDLPWRAQSAEGVELRRVDIRRSGDPEAALIDAIDERSRVLTVSAVQWTDGFRLDLERLGSGCVNSQCLFFVDAIQQLGALPIDVERCRIDCLAADAHKWLLGPEGIAVFYCRESARRALRLRQHGWFMYDNPWDFSQPDRPPSDTARRFEAGSPNNLGQVAMSASLELILEAGLETIAAAIDKNSSLLHERLSAMPGIDLVSPDTRQRRSGIVSIRPNRVDSREFFKGLSARGVTAALRGGNIRLSPHFYQDQNDLEHLLGQIERLL